MYCSSTVVTPTPGYVVYVSRVTILCAGQGVVTVRSPYSDVAFMEAMRSCNYISEGGMEYHAD